jgi:uncharacterized membrane protein YuzA (DUF378 family)
MKCLNGLIFVVMILLILGGINWGLVGIFQYNLIETIFSHVPVLAKVVYILIGFSGIYMLFHLCKLQCKK